MSKRRNKNEGKWEIEQQQFNEGGTEVQTSDCLLRGQYILVTSSNFPIDPLHRFLGGRKNRPRRYTYLCTCKNSE